MIYILLSSIIFSAGSLFYGYSSAGMADAANWMAILGAGWFIALWRHWRWFPAVGLLLSLVVAMAGAWLGLSIGWMFSGAIFALVAWDMTELRQKLLTLPAREDIKGMERRHLIRVGLLVVLGLSIGWLLNAWVSK